MIYFYRLVSLLAWAIRTCSLVLLLIPVVSLIIPYVKDVDRYPSIREIRVYDQKMVKFANENVPTHIGRYDVSQLELIISFFLMIRLMSWVREQCADRTRALKARRHVHGLLTRMKKAKEAYGPKEIKELEHEFSAVKGGHRKERIKLLGDFLTLKKQLEGMERDLVFLSLDVVGSTHMKEGEGHFEITHDFLNFRSFVEEILSRYHVVKSTWTPDGLMCCFLSLPEAVKAAQECLSGLDHFNSSIKKMQKASFAIRCGIYAGRLWFDESIPLEELTDRVIDIAGHLQKNAPINTILLAESAVPKGTSFVGFVLTDIVVDKMRTLVWQKSPETSG